MSRHNNNRRRNYGRRQHELRERPRRWQSVVRQWDVEDGAPDAGSWSEPGEPSAEHSRQQP